MSSLNVVLKLVNCDQLFLCYLKPLVPNFMIPLHNKLQFTVPTGPAPRQALSTRLLDTLLVYGRMPRGSASSLAWRAECLPSSSRGPHRLHLRVFYSLPPSPVRYENLMSNSTPPGAVQSQHVNNTAGRIAYTVCGKKSIP